MNRANILPTLDYEALLQAIYALSAAHHAVAPEGSTAVPSLLSPRNEAMLRALLGDSAYIVTSMAGGDVVAALDRGTDTVLRRLWQSAIVYHTLAGAYQTCQPRLSEAMDRRLTELVHEMHRRADGLPTHITPWQ